MKRLHVVVAALLFVLAIPVLSWGAPNRGQILRADYGSGNYWADVTQRVASMFRRDSLNFRVDNATLGIDPAPRQPKMLRLEIRNRDGQIEQQTYQENEFVHLRGYSIINASFNGLQIFRGVYGDGRRQMDVTDRLNSQIQDGQLSLPVTSDTLGGDPAPGRRKTLTVDYSLNGGSGQMVLNEGDFLNLPEGYRRDDRRDDRHADHRDDRDRDPRGSQPPDNMGSNGGPREGYRTIPAGAIVSIRTNERIDSSTASPGQLFAASMAEDVTDGRGRMLIPKGSEVTLIIRRTAGSSVVLDIDSIVAEGVRYGVSTEDLQKGHQGLGANQRTAQMVGGGAALGAIIGAIAGGGKGAAIGAGVGAAAGAGAEVATQGKDVRVPAETVLNFTLDADLHLERRQR
jgi:hypothetical protein